MNDAQNRAIDEAQKRSENPLIQELAASALYAGVQMPAQGLAQMVDTVTGSELLPKVEFMSAPVEANFGSAQWHAQTVGSGIGMLLPFMLVKKGIYGSKVAQAEATSLAARRAAIGMSLQESAVVGFTTDFLTRPVAPEGNFWAQRFTGGLEGAASFTALTAGSLAINRASLMPELKKNILGAAMRNPAISGTLSGIPGGIASAGIEGIKTGHLSTEDVGKSVYTMMVAGGALGLKAQLLHGTARNGDVTTLCDHLKSSKQTVSDLLKVPTTLGWRGPNEQLKAIFEPERLAKRVSTEERELKMFSHWGMEERFIGPDKTQSEVYKQALPAAQKLLANLERGAAKGKTSASHQDQPVTVEEMNALNTLKTHSREEYKRMSELISQRGPAAEWIVERSSHDYDFSNPRSLAELTNRAKQVVEDRKTWETIKSTPNPPGTPEITLAQAKAIHNLAFEREFHWDTKELDAELAGRGAKVQFIARALKDIVQYEREKPIFGEDGYTKLMARADAVEKALEVAGKTTKEATAGDTITVEEAHALATLKSEKFYSEEPKLRSSLQSRGPIASWVAAEVSGSSGEHGVPFGTKQHITAEGELADLLSRSARLQDAKQLTNKIAQESKPTNVEGTFISVEEANALRCLRWEDSRLRYARNESDTLVAVLAKRGIEAEVIAKVVANKSSHAATEAELKDIVAQYEPAWKALSEVRSKSNATAAAGEPIISLTEARGFSLFHNLGMQEHSRAISGFVTERGGKGAEWMIEQLKKQREPISESQHAEFATNARRYAKAHAVFEQVSEAAKQPKPEGAPAEHGRVTLDQANAYFTLKELHPDEFHSYNSKLVDTNPENIKALKILSNFKGELTQDRINKAFTVNALEPEVEKLNAMLPEGLRLDTLKMVYEGGVTSAQEARDFSKVWEHVRMRQKFVVEAQPDAAEVKAMSQWQQAKQLPDAAIGPVFDHFTQYKFPFQGEINVEQLTRAASAWQIESSIPYTLALKVGDLPLKEQIKAGVAWAETLNERGITRDALRTQVGEECPPELESAFWQRYEATKRLGSSAAVAKLTDTKAIMPAIQTLHGSLSEFEQLQLARAVQGSNAPFKVVANIKAAHYQAALNELQRPTSEPAANAEADTAYGGGAPRSWRTIERGAAGLALTFKGGATQWLKTQRELGVSDHDSTYWLPIKPGEELKGLGSFLMANAKRPSNRLEMVASRWADIPQDVRNQGFEPSLDYLKLKTYPNVKNKEFALEAAGWGISEREYPAFEERFIKSLETESPFPTDKAWSANGLTGRFIPRNDARGIFLGQHTNCCQHPKGAAASAAWFGQENAKSGFFVVEDKDRNVIAQSWVWVADNGGLCFDNVEAKGIGKRADAVKKIYADAANELSQTFHTVTLGTGHSDLSTTGMTAAGEHQLKLPRTYSGYADSSTQVLLAFNKAKVPGANGLPPSEVQVRGAISTDREQLESIAQERYPVGWQDIPLTHETRGLVLENGKGIVGYALYEPSERYISDLAVKAGTPPTQTLKLLRPLYRAIGETPGVWSADCRESTSYAFIQLMQRKGMIEVHSDQLASPMAGEARHNVKFSVVKPTARVATPVSIPVATEVQATQ